MAPHILKWERSHDAVSWFAPKLAQVEKLVLWQSITNAISPYASVPPDFLEEVARRSFDDTEAEILCQSTVREEREAPHVWFQDGLELLSWEQILARTSCTQVVATD